MSDWRRLLSGALMAALSLVLLFGSILLSYAENGYALAGAITGTQTITAVPQVAMVSGVPLSENTTPGARPTDTPTFTPNPKCLPPAGYIVYVVRPGDTLAGLARRFSVSAQAILKASCFETAGLASVSLVEGSTLNVPYLRPTAVAVYCTGAPYNWPVYIVKSGDTLFSLALTTRVSVVALQDANCLGASTRIVVGQMLRLPFIPYIPPVYTQPLPPTLTPLPTASSTLPLPPSWTPVVSVSAATASPTPDGSPTADSTPMASNTAAAYQVTGTLPAPDTNTPDASPSETPPPPPTNTPVPPPSDTPVPPPSNTPVPPEANPPVPPPPPSATPDSAPEANPPVPPAATEVIGWLFYLIFMVLWKS